jgi:serine/threonine protein kinase
MHELIASQTQPVGFGLAQFIDPSRAASARLVGGSAGYIAPEVRENNQLPTIASDIYSLGALLVALVTGHPPRADRPSLESSLLATICARCLSADPQERFSSVAEFLLVLDQS